MDSKTSAAARGMGHSLSSVFRRRKFSALYEINTIVLLQFMVRSNKCKVQFEAFLWTCRKNEIAYVKNKVKIFLFYNNAKMEVTKSRIFKIETTVVGPTF